MKLISSKINKSSTSICHSSSPSRSVADESSFTLARLLSLPRRNKTNEQSIPVTPVTPLYIQTGRQNGQLSNEVSHQMESSLDNVPILPSKHQMEVLYHQQNWKLKVEFAPQAKQMELHSYFSSLPSCELLIDGKSTWQL